MVPDPNPDSYRDGAAAITPHAHYFFNTKKNILDCKSNIFLQLSLNFSSVFSFGERFCYAVNSGYIYQNFKMRKLQVLLVVIAILTSIGARAQCKSFTKKKCMPALAPYTTNGQINTATFSAGDHAEIPLSFFENTSYRVIVCNQEILGKITFKVLDGNKNVLFDNAGVDFVNSWDFKSMSNQSLTLYIEVPEGGSDNHSQMMHSGCVSVIVGFKKG
jgi:hypothetical protein